MTQKIKIGDLVSLRSGGPIMTVSRPGRFGDEVECVWFQFAHIEGYAHLVWEQGRGWFGAQALEIVSSGSATQDAQ
jgi:uncharacterized protein YodC (DUF2158 family)